jgi:glyoxylase-like metal-dependent hydrolase (beta-lactamase superfamily II)
MGQIVSMLAPLTVSRPPLEQPPSPVLARWFTPAGPASMSLVEAGDGRVISVPGRYCMTHIIEGPQSLVLVDVGSISDLSRIEAAVEWIGKPVSLVIPSHLHFDHIMGIDAAAERFGAKLGLGLVAHNHVTAGRRLRFIRPVGPKMGFLVWLWQGLPVFAREDMPGGFQFGFPWSRNPFTAPLSDLLLDGKMVPGLPGWMALDTPGHADDAICLYHADGGLLVAGDTVRNFQGGEWNTLMSDPAAYANTQARLEALEVQAAFPGHGPVLIGKKILMRLRYDLKENDGDENGRKQ